MSREPSGGPVDHRNTDLSLICRVRTRLYALPLAHVVETLRPLPVQVDGDHIGYTPMTFESAPGALRALLPSTLPTDLLHAERATPRRAWRRMLGWIGGRRAGDRASSPEAREEIRR